MKIVLFLILISQLVLADDTASTPKTDHERIVEIFNERLSALSNPEAFKKFTLDHKKLFPDPKDQNPSMVVERETVEVDGEKYTLAIGYRQVMIKGKSDLIKSLWGAPELFQKVYDLDASSVIEEDKKTPTQFKARIYKKVPAIADQDYILDYSIQNLKSFTFVRAKLDKDLNEFALRDNLKVLEETPDGLIVREISYLYPLKWYVRALGPTARSTMKKELNKVSFIEKCLVESNSSFPPSEEIIENCVHSK